ncbi:transcription factor RF2b-like [Gastrolobium bilobum]|uniref:transcription factor RF2b-like n=1 Tax=Gastrolobium bilobum TaxID=150636 RepID=UPI002AB14EBE|nr:transcription factor RF2b-like [Gastrolobium bilobum]
MEPNFTKVPPENEHMQAPQQSEPHHQSTSTSDDSFCVDNSFDELLHYDSFEFDISSFPPPPPPSATEMVGSLGEPADPAVGEAISLSVSEMGMAGAGEMSGGERGAERRQRRRKSVERSSSRVSRGVMSSSLVKKAMAPEKLEELVRVDPKRAKRILANRKSAAISKERKTRYINELGKDVQRLQIEANTTAAEYASLEGKNTDKATQNKERIRRTEATLQEARLKDDLVKAMKIEFDRFKIDFGITDDHPFFAGMFSQFSSQLPPHMVPNPRFQNQVLQQPQFSMPPPPPPPPPSPPLFGEPFGEDRPPPLGEPFDAEDFDPDFSNFR